MAEPKAPPDRESLFIRSKKKVLRHPSTIPDRRCRVCTTLERASHECAAGFVRRGSRVIKSLLRPLDPGRKAQPPQSDQFALSRGEEVTLLLLLDEEPRCNEKEDISEAAR